MTHIDVRRTDRLRRGDLTVSATGPNNFDLSWRVWSAGGRLDLNRQEVIRLRNALTTALLENPE